MSKTSVSYVLNWKHIFCLIRDVSVLINRPFFPFLNTLTELIFKSMNRYTNNINYWLSLYFHKIFSGPQKNSCDISKMSITAISLSRSWLKLFLKLIGQKKGTPVLSLVKSRPKAEILEILTHKTNLKFRFKYRFQLIKKSNFKISWQFQVFKVASSHETQKNEFHHQTI